jgi:hypothetical protein
LFHPPSYEFTYRHEYVKALSTRVGAGDGTVNSS